MTNVRTKKSRKVRTSKIRPYRNELELRIWTIGTSGKHAIMTWIASMVGEPVYLFETLKAEKDGDPYLTKWPTKDYLLKRDQGLSKLFVPLPYMGNWTEKQKQSIRSKPKKCLMYSYILNHRNRTHYEIIKDAGDTVGNRAKVIGKSKKQYDVVIMRDIYNWFASSIVRGMSIHNTRKLNKYIDLWYCLAREATGKINSLPFKKIFVSYNRWFTSEAYRKQLAKDLGLKYSDETINKIPLRGSTFDGLAYQDKAQEMKVLERWQMLSKENLTLCQTILKNHPQATELSDEIFGKIF